VEGGDEVCVARRRGERSGKAEGEEREELEKKEKKGERERERISRKKERGRSAVDEALIEKPTRAE
jgi:hypothetical protein